MIRHSIVTKLILFGIAIALLTGVGRYFVLTRFLRADFEKVVVAQQAALASYVARDIDHKIIERQHMLKRLAATLPPDLLEHPEELHAWLCDRHEIQPLFSHGLFVTNTKGTVIADYPRLTQRAGAAYGEDDYIRMALSGELAVGRAVIGRVEGEPVVPMAIPIKNNAGEVLAVLAGITATAAPGFFDSLQQVRIGETGGFLLISPQDQIFVAATKPELVLKPTAAPGVNPLHDRALAGFRGSGVTVNAQGVEEVAAFASVPSTGWFVVARLPTEEAFATVTRTQDFIFRNTILVIGIFLVILTVGLTVLFRPLTRAAIHADGMTRGDLPLEPLPIERADEIGNLIRAFNRLLAKFRATQSKLVEMAHHDTLTALPNRLLLADRMGQTLARSRRDQTSLAVLFLDLDGFKPINDSLGHEAGDLALVEIAQRLGTIVREADTLARVGGDEFVVVLGDLDPDTALAEAGAGLVATKCIDILRQPMTIKGEVLSVGVSVGIAIGHGESSFDQLMLLADRAMYKAKQSGRDRYAFAEHATAA